jgi:hypothetical protein
LDILPRSAIFASAPARKLYRTNLDLLSPTSEEHLEVDYLRQDGYALLPEFFPIDIIDRIYRRADALFRALQIDVSRAHSIQSKLRTNFAGLTYDQIAATEKTIELRDPLAQVPETADLAFHPGILRIAGTFLGQVPSFCRVSIVRDFPPNHACHANTFHKESDNSDSLQVFIYLVDIDEAHGPVIFVPGSNHHDVRSCRPRLANDFNVYAGESRYADEEIARVYPPPTWAVLRTGRGAVAMIHGNGIHKNLAWPKISDVPNQARTAIKVDLRCGKSAPGCGFNENLMRHDHFECLSELQKLFAHAAFVPNAYVGGSAIIVR